MSEQRINLKKPWLAALLAFLLPGAGHLYQGRTFKGALYFVCVLGTFLYGLQMAEWRAVYAFAGDPVGPRKRVYGYLAQMGVGGPAMLALAQGYRYRGEDNRPLDTLEAPLTGSFTGAVVQGDRAVAPVSGMISLQPAMGRFGPDVEGVFEGVLEGEDGAQPLKLRLEGSFRLEHKLSADPRRRVEVAVAERMEGPPGIETGQLLSGTMPRPFWNWFAIPPEQAQIEQLHRDLGRFFDLGMVYTWIAGLLNVLAIWDAAEGPAYGYGDEEDEESADEKQKRASADPPPESAEQEPLRGDGAPPPSRVAEKAAQRS